MSDAFRKTLPRLLLCAILLMAASCQSQNASTAKGINIWHVVLVRLNDPDDAVARQAIIDASKSFTAIPGVLSVHAGRIASGDRLNQSNDFDIGIVIGFRSLQAVHSYVNDPAHKKAMTEILKPLAKGYTSYDFANE